MVGLILGTAALLVLTGCAADETAVATASETISASPTGTASASSAPSTTASAPTPIARTSEAPSASGPPSAAATPQVRVIRSTNFDRFFTVDHDEDATRDDTYDKNGAETMVTKPMPPGGSSVQMVSPCDGGTATLSAQPYRGGVAVRGSVRGVAHRTWTKAAVVDPEHAPQGDAPPGPPNTAVGGVLIETGTNLYNHTTFSPAWPSWAFAGFDSTETGGPSCGGGVYLSSARAFASTGDSPMAFEIERDRNVLRVQDLRIPEAGVWNITASVWSAAGRHRFRTAVKASVTNSVRDWSAVGKVRMLKLNALAVDITGLVGLPDFTKVTVTVTSRDGRHTTWLTLARTP